MCVGFAGSREIEGTMDARVAGFDANKLRALIAKYLGIDAEQVTDEAHFRNDFELDSLDQLELLILIEEEFSGVEFSDAAVEQIQIVGDLIRYAQVHRQSRVDAKDAARRRGRGARHERDYRGGPPVSCPMIPVWQERREVGEHS